MRAPTVEAMDVLLPTWENPAVTLGPYTVHDPETEVVRPRHLQLAPGRIASILIHRRQVSAKTAHQELLGAIQAEGAMDTYNNVITWLRATCTARGGGGAQNTIPSLVYALCRCTSHKKCTGMSPPPRCNTICRPCPRKAAQEGRQQR